jgi:hypothetical protein
LVRRRGAASTAAPGAPAASSNTRAAPFACHRGIAAHQRPGDRAIEQQRQLGRQTIRLRHGEPREQIAEPEPALFGGGLLFDALGNYDVAWRCAVALGLAAGIVQVGFDVARPLRLAPG